jgi:hypothetical protein
MIDYICRQIDDNRVFIGVEGEELTLAEAIRITGNKPFVFSTFYPHEFDAETCNLVLEELGENPELTSADKDAILFGDARRFYGLG